MIVWSKHLTSTLLFHQKSHGMRNKMEEERWNSEQTTWSSSLAYQTIINTTFNLLLLFYAEGCSQSFAYLRYLQLSNNQFHLKSITPMVYTIIWRTKWFIQSFEGHEYEDIKDILGLFSVTISELIIFGMALTGKELSPCLQQPPKAMKSNKPPSAKLHTLNDGIYQVAAQDF